MYYEPIYTDPGMSFYGPDTTAVDAMLVDNGGFYWDNSGMDAMFADVGGSYGPDTSWLQTEMDANFDPNNPYIYDAVAYETGYAEATYDYTNAQWDDYFTM